MTRASALLRILLLGCGWLGVAHGAPSAGLEVLGQITVHAELEATAEGQNIVRGRLSDEVGRPVPGELVLLSAAGRRVEMEPCPWFLEVTPEEDTDTPRKEKPLLVGEDGEFCFITDNEKGLILKAQATHFVETSHDMDLGYERALSRPRFVEAPPTIDLFEQAVHVVQVLGRAERTPPEGSRLSLSLVCQKEHLISEVSLNESRVQRFEFSVPKDLSPGNCQFVARASSPTRKLLQATRSVLVRDRVALRLDKEARKDGTALVTVAVNGSAPSPGVHVEGGLLEARDNGAFVALSPVRNGLGELELEMGQMEREILLSYVSASPAFLAGEPLAIHIPPKTTNSQWAGIHVAGLLLFASWLGYAWLRPRREEKSSVTVPPKKAQIQSSGEKAGAVRGRVLDAHTGAPLGKAKLVLVRVSAEHSEDLETVFTDETGSFELKTQVESHPLLRVVASSDHHMTLTATVKSAQITVHLTERRRAVISSLTSWARKASGPWDRKPSATPGSIELTARQKAEPAVADWARSVATAAYAEGVPSEITVESLKGPQGPTPGS